MKESYYETRVINDWEEQNFANLIEVQTSTTVGKPEFSPTPPHVGGTPPWKSSSEIPFYQKTPDKLRP